MRLKCCWCEVAENAEKRSWRESENDQSFGGQKHEDDSGKDQCVFRYAS